MSDEAIETVMTWRKAWAPYINDGVKASIDSLVQRLREAEEQLATALDLDTRRAKATRVWIDRFNAAEERAEKAEAERDRKWRYYEQLYGPRIAQLEAESERLRVALREYPGGNRAVERAHRAPREGAKT